MAKPRLLGPSISLSVFALLGCGQVSRGDTPAAGAGTAGTSTTTFGGAPSGGRAGSGGSGGFGGAAIGPGGSNVGGAAEREHAVCENEFVVVPALPEDVQLGFTGTIDGQATELTDGAEPPGVPVFGVLRFGEHLEAVDLNLRMTAAPGDIYVHVSVANCKLFAQLLLPYGDGLEPFILQTGWLRSTTVTTDWQQGTTTGALHFELANESGSQRHALDGSFVWSAHLSDSRP